MKEILNEVNIHDSCEIVNLHSTKGTHWVMYSNQNYFVNMDAHLQ